MHSLFRWLPLTQGGEILPQWEGGYFGFLHFGSRPLSGLQ